MSFWPMAISLFMRPTPFFPFFKSPVPLTNKWVLERIKNCLNNFYHIFCKIVNNLQKSNVMKFYKAPPKYFLWKKLGTHKNQDNMKAQCTL